MNLHLSFDHSKGMRLESQEPDEEDLGSFLMDFRMFISEKEPIFIPRIRSLIEQGLDATSPLRVDLRKSKKVWNQQFKSGILKLNPNGKRSISPGQECILLSAKVGAILIRWKMLKP